MAEKDWQQVLDHALAAREPSRAPRKSIAVNYPPSLYRHVLAAAEARGMTMAAYQRRAALAFAQLDTGFDWAEEMKAEPAFATFTDIGRSSKHAGTGFGYWLISEVRDV